MEPYKCSEHFLSILYPLYTFLVLEAKYDEFGVIQKYSGTFPNFLYPLCTFPGLVAKCNEFGTIWKMQ